MPLFSVACPPLPRHFCHLACSAQVVTRSLIGQGRSVRLACIGWNQVNNSIPLEQQTRLMAAHGFNCIRFSWVNATMQQDLQMIDRVVAAARAAGLRLVLDNHTNEAGPRRPG